MRANMCARIHVSERLHRGRRAQKSALACSLARSGGGFVGGLRWSRPLSDYGPGKSQSANVRTFCLPAGLGWVGRHVMAKAARCSECVLRVAAVAGRK